MTVDSITRGDVFYVNDALVIFEKRPDERELHPRRTIIIVSCDDTNRDPDWALILAVPTTSQEFYSSAFCVHLPRARGSGNLPEESWAIAPVVQPFRKTDLTDFLGKLSPENMELLESEIAFYTGIKEIPAASVELESSFVDSLWEEAVATSASDDDDDDDDDTALVSSVPLPSPSLFKPRTRQIARDAVTLSAPAAH